MAAILSRVPLLKLSCFRKSENSCGGAEFFSRKTPRVNIIDEFRSKCGNPEYGRLPFFFVNFSTLVLLEFQNCVCIFSENQ